MSLLINDEPGIRIATSSIFLRSDVFKDFPNWRLNFPVEDVPMYMNALLKGKIHRLKDIMCVYRQFANGSWSTQNKNDIVRKLNHINSIINSTQEFNVETNYKYNDLVKKQILNCEFRIYYLNRDFPNLFQKKFKYLFRRLPFKERISLKLQYRMPKLYKTIHKRGK